MFFAQFIQTLRKHTLSNSVIEDFTETLLRNALSNPAIQRSASSYKHYFYGIRDDQGNIIGDTIGHFAREHLSTLQNLLIHSDSQEQTNAKSNTELVGYLEDLIDGPTTVSQLCDAFRSEIPDISQDKKVLAGQLSVLCIQTLYQAARNTNNDASKKRCSSLTKESGIPIDVGTEIHDTVREVVILMDELFSLGEKIAKWSQRQPYSTIYENSPYWDHYNKKYQIYHSKAVELLLLFELNDCELFASIKNHALIDLEAFWQCHLCSRRYNNELKENIQETRNKLLAIAKSLKQA